MFAAAETAAVSASTTTRQPVAHRCHDRIPAPTVSTAKNRPSTSSGPPTPVTALSRQPSPQRPCTALACTSALRAASTDPSTRTAKGRTGDAERLPAVHRCQLRQVHERPPGQDRQDHQGDQGQPRRATAPRRRLVAVPHISGGSQDSIRFGHATSMSALGAMSEPR